MSSLLYGKHKIEAKMVAESFISNKRKSCFVPQPLQKQPKMENLGDDDFESHYGSDNFEDAASGDDQSTSRNGAAKRKKYHRHTTFQIQELEASFKDNPHPDEKARLELGKRLSLLPRQVKFWFQNRRTQVKTQVGRHENSLLKQENDKLRMENIAMKEAMANPTCNNCGGPAILGEIPLEEQQLMIENARLKDELDRLNTLALGRANGLVLTPTVRNSSLDLSVGRNGFMDSTSFSFPMGLEFGGHGHQLSSVFSGMNSVVGSPSPFDNKSLFLELALSAMEELVKLAQVDSPLWCASFKGIGEMLNIEEYSKLFSSCCIGSKPNHFVSQGTRAAATVMIESGALVENLMDSDQWTKMFPWTIGKASTVHVVSRGVGGKNGALQLMQAEFQVLSPMVPVRQVKFVRFVKKHSENIWAIVDVSADAISPSLNKNTAMICRRLPSGCILQDLGNGFSKVTWIEHMEYDESIVHHLYRPVISSGIAFGAQKWVANLQRQCELLPVIMSTPITGDDSELGPNGRKCVAELAQRMTRIFCTGVCATTHNWEVIQIGEDSKLIFRKTTGTSGEPNGIILSATMTVWVPVSPQRLLEFLTDVKCRVHWDILSQDGPMHQTLQIPKSHDPGNHISLLSTSVVNPSAYQSNVLILQDATTDASGSVIVHAAVDTGAMKLVLKGEDSSSVTVLPSGFAVVPDCYKDLSRPENGGEGSSSGTITGSMLTAGFQILASSQPAGTKVNMESVDTIKSLIVRTVDGIKNGLQINSDG